MVRLIITRLIERDNACEANPVQAKPGENYYLILQGGLLRNLTDSIFNVPNIVYISVDAEARCAEHDLFSK